MKTNELKQKMLETKFIKDNEFLDKYVQLILSNVDNKFNVYTSQCHHIIPRCYYKITKQNINGEKSNLVNLLYKDHLLAHYYLCLCSDNDQFFYANYLALKIVISTIQYWDKDFANVEKKLRIELDKLQVIYEKKRSYIKKRDLNFYDKVNELKEKGKNSAEIAQYFNISVGGCFSRYHSICKRNNLPIFKAKPWWGDDIDFYNLINKNAAEGKMIDESAKDFNKSPALLLKKYKEICKKNKLNNIYYEEKYRISDEEIQLVNKIILTRKALWNKYWNEYQQKIQEFYNKFSAKMQQNGNKNFAQEYKKWRQNVRLPIATEYANLIQRELEKTMGMTKSEMDKIIRRVGMKKGKQGKINKTREQIREEDLQYVKLCESRLNQGYSWQDIANELNGNEFDLSSKYYNTLKKLKIPAPSFRDAKWRQWEKDNGIWQDRRKVRPLTATERKERKKKANRFGWIFAFVVIAIFFIIYFSILFSIMK